MRIWIRSWRIFHVLGDSSRNWNPSHATGLSPLLSCCKFNGNFWLQSFSKCLLGNVWKMCFHWAICLKVLYVRIQTFSIDFFNSDTKFLWKMPSCIFNLNHAVSFQREDGVAYEIKFGRGDKFWKFPFLRMNSQWRS